MEQVLKKDDTTVKPIKNTRNYELDFLRLVFAVIIFLSHTQFNGFVGPNTRFRIIPMMGEISVHFFFIASGMLMANSIVKKDVNQNFGKAAMDFVLGKFKSIAWILVVSGAIAVSVHIFIYLYNGNATVIGVGNMLAKIFPELFEVTMSGMNIRYNSTWYISAMLICMLPLSYIMYRKRSFALYVLSPLAALLTFGYMCWTNNYSFLD